MYRIVLNETSYYGAGCRSVIADEVRKRGFSKALLVTDKDLIRFGVAEKIEEVLRNAGIPYEIFSDLKANPTITNVKDGVAAFKAAGADFIIALGGGSGSSLGTGGMATKLRAAQMATAAGCEMVIANGQSPEVLYDVAAGKRVGTRFLAKGAEA